MFPLRDENPTELTPYMTYALIAANIAVFVFVQGAGMDQQALAASVCRYGAVPAEITGRAAGSVDLGGYRCALGGPDTPLTLLTSMFMHGGPWHLLGNMWFLWVFGNNVEDSMGHVRFVLFYLLTGAVAAGTHILTAAGSELPMVGASGAISGVMGAYLVLYPRVRILTWVLIFIFRAPAWAMLGYWFIIQLLLGSDAAGTSGVAFWAHIGGFVAGVALIKLFERKELVEAKISGRQLTPEEIQRIMSWRG